MYRTLPERLAASASSPSHNRSPNRRSPSASTRLRARFKRRTGCRDVVDQQDVFSVEVRRTTATSMPDVRGTIPCVSTDLGIGISHAYEPVGLVLKSKLFGDAFAQKRTLVIPPGLLSFPMQWHRHHLEPVQLLVGNSPSQEITQVIGKKSKVAVLESSDHSLRGPEYTAAAYTRSRLWFSALHSPHISATSR